ncbi:MAG: putative glycolipid-binding domain-containing protein [Sulfitobacter sp.]
MAEICQYKRAWRWEDGSVDFVSVLEGSEGWRVSGRHGNQLYRVTADASFMCQSVRVTLGKTSGNRDFSFVREAGGWRNDDGALVPNSINALDIDLSWSALTNSFPIRRMSAQGQTTADFDVLMIAPELGVSVVKQTYTREGDRWHYQNHNSAFSARLTVDKQGLVTDYPGVCRATEIPS